MTAKGATANAQEEQTVTLTEAIKALKTLRTEFADLRMLIRAARTADDGRADENDDARVVR
jgi:hypothetical protein